MQYYYLNIIHKNIKYIIYICLIVLSTICLSNDNYVAKLSLDEEEMYIQKYKDYGILEQEIFKIPASITLAQALIESAHGTSILAIQANALNVKKHG